MAVADMVDDGRGNGNHVVGGQADALGRAGRSRGEADPRRAFGQRRVRDFIEHVRALLGGEEGRDRHCRHPGFDQREIVQAERQPLIHLDRERAAGAAESGDALVERRRELRPVKVVRDAALDRDAIGHALGVVANAVSEHGHALLRSRRASMADRRA